jgi:hypothetical protein
MEANAEGLSATGAYLFGRRTYEKMAAFWPTGPSDVPFTSHATANRLQNNEQGHRRPHLPTDLTTSEPAHLDRPSRLPSP